MLLSGLTDSAEYFITLTAFDIAGNESDFGNVVSAMPVPGCCLTPADANNDQSVDIADVVFIVNYMFCEGHPHLVRHSLIWTATAR